MCIRDSLGGLYRFIRGKGLVRAVSVHVVKLRVVEHYGRVKACYGRGDLYRFPGRVYTFFRTVLGKADHELYTKLEAVGFYQLAGIVYLLCRVPSVGCSQHVGIEGLYAKLYDVGVVCFEIVKYPFVDIIGPR